MDFIERLNSFINRWFDLFNKTDQNEILPLVKKKPNSQNEKDNLKASILINIWYAITHISKQEQKEPNSYNYSYDEFKGIKEDYFKTFWDEICEPEKARSKFSILEGINLSVFYDKEYYKKCGLQDLWMVVDYTDFKFGECRDYLFAKFLNLVKNIVLNKFDPVKPMVDTKYFGWIKNDIDQFLSRGVNPTDWLNNCDYQLYFQLFMVLTLYLGEYNYLLRFEDDLREGGYFKQYYVITYFFKQMKEEKNPIFKRGYERIIFVKLMFFGIKNEFIELQDNKKLMIKEKVVKEAIYLNGWFFNIHYKSMSVLFTRFLKSIVDKNVDKIPKRAIEKVANHIEWLYDPDELPELEELKNRFVE